jgi:8-oxo-dGTP diphosphatase
MHTYTDPGRDPRGHYASTVYIVETEGEAVGADDAKEAVWIDLDDIDAYKDEIVFDHYGIIQDYLRFR